MMEIDSRIKSEDDIFNPLNKRKAEKYLGKTGYFFSCVSAAEDLSSADVIKGKLTEIAEDYTDYVYISESGAQDRYFIPEELLLQKSKILKYRPYTLAEWIGQHTIGDVIRYRCKSQKIELRHLYVGYGYGIGTDIKNTTSGTLTLGVASYSLNYLLEDYEIEVNGEWLPFGVIDEQGAGE